jgi:hypothetical protein
MLRLGPTLTEEVPQQDNRRGPHRPAESAVEEERAPAHAAYACTRRSKHAEDRDETGREDGLSTVAYEEPFDLRQALRGDLDVAPPLQVELWSSSAARPVTDLVADDSPKDAKHYGLSEFQLTLLNQDAGG